MSHTYETDQRFFEIVAMESRDAPTGKRVDALAAQLTETARILLACGQDYKINAFLLDGQSLGGILLFRPSLDFMPEDGCQAPETSKEYDEARFKQSRSDYYEAQRDMQNAIESGAAIYGLEERSTGRAFKKALKWAVEIDASDLLECPVEANQV